MPMMLMMLDLVKEAGIFRSGGVGVFAGDDLIHAGTLPQYVPEAQDKLLALLKKDNKISAKSAAEKLNLSERQVQRLLKTMKENGLIERVGSNRNGRWNVL